MSRPRRRFGEVRATASEEDPVSRVMLYHSQNIDDVEPTETPTLGDPLDVHTPTGEEKHISEFPSLLEHMVTQTGDGDDDDQQACNGSPPPRTASGKAGSGSFRQLGSVSSFRKRLFGVSNSEGDSQQVAVDALSFLDQFPNVADSGDGDRDGGNAETHQHHHTLGLFVDEENPSALQTPGALRGGSAKSLKPLRNLATHQEHTHPKQNDTHQHQPFPPRTSPTLSAAARASSPFSVDVPNEIRCPVCLDGFHEPVTLSCNHNVCKEHVLDLACQEEGFTKPTQEFSVKCPKCRVSTHFPSGVASVKVNHEMNAVVTMMMNLLARQQQKPTAMEEEATAVVTSSSQHQTPPRPTSQSNPPPRSRGSARKAVTFNDGGNMVVMLGGSKDGMVFTPNGTNLPMVSVASQQQANSALPPLESALKRGEPNTSGATSPQPSSAVPKLPDTGPNHTPDSKRVLKAQKQLEGLEKQLEAQRERMRNEREEAARQKVLDYKRARQEEIDRRRQELLLELQAEEENELHGDQGFRPTSFSRETGRHVQSPDIDDRVWSAAEKTLQQLKEERRRRKEVERDERERAVREGVQQWVNKAPSQPLVSLDGSALEKHLRAVAEFESGNLHLNESQKAREAEEKIMHMYKAPTASEKERRNRPPTPEARDWEVEETLWQVEQQVLREQEAELTRAQMAEIAEQRARELIAQFASRSGSSPKTPLKPSYIPKLNRLQKFS